MYPIRLIHNLYIITYAKDKSNKFFLGAVPVIHAQSKQDPFLYSSEIDDGEMNDTPNDLEKQYRSKFNCIEASHQRKDC